MRTHSALLVLVAIAGWSSASAQDVIVNPQAISGTSNDSQVLIDPATGQQRTVPALMQPWQFEQVPLHQPHRIKATGDAVASVPEKPPVAKTHVAAAPDAGASDSLGGAANEPPPPPAPKKTKVRQAAASPQAAPPPAQGSGYHDFTDLISAQPATPPRKKVASQEPAPQATTIKPAEAKPAEPVETPKPEKPIQKASIERKPHVVTGSRKDSIAFAPNATDPSTSSVSAIRALAGSLNTALGDANARVQLLAYAGGRDEKSSDTRRLSLKRALVVRQLLIDDGVPSERIDVFALGGADDGGALDRVDVFVKR